MRVRPPLAGPSNDGRWSGNGLPELAGLRALGLTRLRLPFYWVGVAPGVVGGCGQSKIYVPRRPISSPAWRNDQNRPAGFPARFTGAPGVSEVRDWGLAYAARKSRQMLRTNSPQPAQDFYHMRKSTAHLMYNLGRRAGWPARARPATSTV